MTTQLHQQGATPARRRRRGACEGCRHSKVRCDGKTPCEYCEKYDRTCQYPPTRLRRNNSLSVSITPNAGSILAQEDIIKTTPLITSSSSVDYEFDYSLHGQNEITDLGGHVLNDLWTPLEGRQAPTPADSTFINCDWYEAQPAGHDHKAISGSGALASNFDHATYGENTTNAPIQSEIFTDNLSNFNSSNNEAVQDFETFQTHPWTGRFQQHGIMQQVLSEAEQSAVGSAICRLYSTKPLNDSIPNSSLSSVAQNQELWKLINNEGWRNARISAAFEVYTGISDFLHRSDITALANDILGDPLAESLSMALVLSVIAIGCQVLQADITVPQASTRQSRQMFSESCARIAPFLLGHNSLLKLQALITLAIASVRSDAPNVPDLISNMRACARILHARHVSTSERYLLREDARLYNLNLALGAAYCLEHHFDSSVILTEKGSHDVYMLSPEPSCNLGDFDVGSCNDFRTNWMASQVELSKLYAKIPRALMDDSDKLDLEAKLQTWRHMLPVQYRDIDRPHPRDIISDSRKLWLFCRYYDALLQIQLGPTGSRFDLRVFSTAKVIMEATSILPTMVVHSNRICDLVSLATCICFLAALNDDCGPKESKLPYLGMASGFFARLALRRPEPFAAIMSLMQVAHQVVGRLTDRQEGNSD